MKKVSDIKLVQETAVSFLHLDIIKTDIPFIIQHPFWNTIYQSYQNKMVNILEDSDTYQYIIKELEEQIRQTNNIGWIITRILKPYRMVFFKYIHSYLSQEDFSYYLAQIWVESEDPNQDPNVSVSTVIRWFKKADKKYLMTSSEDELYNNLPECLKIYRGVAVGRNSKGISWTNDYEKAEWFSKRFDTSDKKGYILTAYIDKEHILTEEKKKLLLIESI